MGTGAFSQIYIQAVFAVKGRQNLIHPSWGSALYRYMAGIIRGKGQTPIIVNGVSDHVHLFFELKPAMGLSDLMRDVKCNSSKFINEQRFITTRFAWQEGYGAFSCSYSSINNVYNYILNQEQHHRSQKFRDEFTAFLNDFEIKYDEKYLFEWYD